MGTPKRFWENIRESCTWIQRHDVDMTNVLLNISQSSYLLLNYNSFYWKRALWLAKSRVYITVCKTWKGSRDHTSSHAVTENLRFDKGYFYVFVFYTLFYKRNRKHFPRVPIRYSNTSGSLGERSRNCNGNFHAISSSPKLPWVSFSIS